MIGMQAVSTKSSGSTAVEVFEPRDLVPERPNVKRGDLQTEDGPSVQTLCAFLVAFTTSCLL